MKQPRKQPKQRRRFSGPNITRCEVCGSTHWGYLRFPTPSEQRAGLVTMCDRCVRDAPVRPSLWSASETNEESNR